MLPSLADGFELNGLYCQLLSLPGRLASEQQVQSVSSIPMLASAG